MAKIRVSFLFTCCLLVAIGPLNLLQMMAWGSMFHDYSKDRSLVEAAEMTLGGEHPCEMCLKITETKLKKNQENDHMPLRRVVPPSWRLDIQRNIEAPEPKPNWNTILEMEPGERHLMGQSDCLDFVPTPPPKVTSC